jgi:methylase of polypeptide subunit release factors
MLDAAPFEDIHSLGNFLSGSGYDTQHLSDELDLAEGLYANRENLEPLLLKTEGDDLLRVLARLFFVGWPVEEELCRRVIPASFLTIAANCGLLTRAHGTLESAATFIPFRGRLIACDSPRLRSGNPNMVIGPGSSTHFIARLAAAGDAETTLDIGSGPGVLALEAAAYSRHVTGTDINPRTLPFASFNAALNGVTNAQFLCGDAFAPVAGRRFSRIIANPPFFLSPVKQFTYCDSPLELDGFTRRLAVECSDYLDEGGYFQMICQWADIEGQPSEQRLREWTAASGCDVLVLLAPSAKPLTYAEVRAKEARLIQTAAEELTLASRLNYLRQRGVQTVLSGVITMRKRSGANWFLALRCDPAGPNVGPGVRERFETITFLATHSEAKIFETRFRFAPDVELATVTRPTAPQWTTLSTHLVKSEGLVDRLQLDEVVTGCLPFFDGQSTLREISHAVAAKLAITPEDAHQRCLQLTRRMLQSSFLLPA